jgi:putative addiction module antidote
MNAALKITKIGNSAGVILPKELLAHLGAKVGDKLGVVRTSRGIEIKMADPEFDEQIGAAREVMARRHQAMMALANEIMDRDREILATLAKT